MSFNFSDNEEEDFDLDAYDDTGLLALASRDKTTVSNDDKMQPAAAAAVATPSPMATTTCAKSRVGAQDMAEESFGEEDVDGGDWDNVNWEDANDEEEDSDDDTPQNFPTQGVMINFGKSNTAGKSNTPDGDNEDEDKKMSAEEKDETNSTRVLRNVPYETQQMILNVRRSGILCEVVQSMQYSYLCGSGGSSELEDDNGMLLSTLAYSMIPQEFHNQQDSTGYKYQPTIPTKQQLHDFSSWFFTFVNEAGERRRGALERNVAQGAVASTSTTRQRGRRQSRGNKKQAAKKKEGTYNDIDSSSQTQNDKPTPINLLQTLMYLSPQYDEDPQLFVEEEDGVDAITAVENITSHEKVLLFLTMIRSLGWRARYVTALNPLSLELTVDHPLLSSFPVSGKKSSLGKNKTRQVHKLLGLLHDKKKAAAAPTETIDLMSSDDEEEDAKPKAKEMSTANNTSPTTLPTTPSVNVNSLSWVEVLCRDDSSEKKQIKTLKKSNQPVAMWIPIHPEQESVDKPEEVESILAWMDMKSNSSKEEGDGGEKKKRKGKWGKAPSYTKRSANTFLKKMPVSYVLAVEHSLSKRNSFNSQLRGVRLTDVTPRYANTWSRTLRLRGATGKDLTKRGGKCVDEWWESSLKQMNRHCRSKQQGKKIPSKSPAVKSVTKTRTSNGKDVDLIELDSSDDEKATQTNAYDSDEHEDREAKELTGGIEKKEKIPTSKKGFKESPFYVIPSVLNSQDVLHPDARKRICGVFKGEMVYKRSDVSKALRADKWLYQGRKVKESEMDKPVKKIKARKKSVAKGFNALSSYGVSEEAQEEMIASIDKDNKKKSAGDDQKMHNLYGIFQTERWKPPHVGPNDAIPTNEFRNVELALINPGLTHMDRKGLAPIAKKLGIPYAPCMLGYEGSHAVVRGIVVHSHNVELMQMASVEYESHAVEKQRENKRKEIIKKWKRLVVGLMTKERLDREYG